MRRTRRTWQRSALLPALALVLGVSALVSGPRAVRADTDSVPAAASAEDAVRLAVESQGNRYSGDCATIRSPEDIGKDCSRFVAEQSGLRAYLVGRVLSEFRGWIFVASGPAGWQVVGVAPLAASGSLTAIPWPAGT